MEVLAVDPGLRGCGVALFRDGRLIAAAYVRGSKDAKDQDAWYAVADAVHRWRGEVSEDSAFQCVAEFPKVYSAGKSKGDPEDLLQLAAVVGYLGPQIIYRPYQWKGQVPKDVMGGRILRKLEQEELAKLPNLAKSYFHNVVDAIGIGLYHLGRL